MKEADTVEATDVVADVPQDIDYDAVYSGLDSYDFDGIDYSSDVDRLDSSLENFQDGAWENLSVDEQKAAMSDLADYPVRVQAALDNLNAVMNEIAEFRRYYEEQRAKKSELLSTVEFL